MSAYDFDDEPDDLDNPTGAELAGGPLGESGAEPDGVAESGVAGPDDPLFGGLDVAAIAAQLVEPAVRRAIGKKVDALAAAAVSQALTPEVLDRWRAEADEAAQLAVRGGGPAGAASAAGAAEEAAPRLYYGSTNEFVREHLRFVYRRKVDGQRTFWSPRWWTCDEAIARLEALWRAWEQLRLDPSTGPSVWWRDHADPHMGVLMSSTGPFSREVDVRAGVLDPLPHEEPPEWLFPDVRDASSP